MSGIVYVWPNEWPQQGVRLQRSTMKSQCLVLPAVCRLRHAASQGLGDMTEFCHVEGSAANVGADCPVGAAGERARPIKPQAVCRHRSSHFNLLRWSGEPANMETFQTRPRNAWRFAVSAATPCRATCGCLRRHEVAMSPLHTSRLQSTLWHCCLS